jgi:hypothetical protein
VIHHVQAVGVGGAGWRVARAGQSLFDARRRGAPGRHFALARLSDTEPGSRRRSEKSDARSGTGPAAGVTGADA